MEKKLIIIVEKNGFYNPKLLIFTRVFRQDFVRKMYEKGYGYKFYDIKIQANRLCKRISIPINSYDVHEFSDDVEEYIEQFVNNIDKAIFENNKVSYCNNLLKIKENEAEYSSWKERVEDSYVVIDDIDINKELQEIKSWKFDEFKTYSSAILNKIDTEIDIL